MKTVLQIRDSEVVRSKRLGENLYHDPMLKIIEAANNIGLKGHKIETVETFHSQVNDYDNNTYDPCLNITFYSSRVSYVPFYDEHGQGD